jgi:hypothetical protein
VQEDVQCKSSDTFTVSSQQKLHILVLLFLTVVCKEAYLVFSLHLDSETTDEVMLIY